MPLNRDEFNRRMSEVLNFLSDLLHHPEHLDNLPGVVRVPGMSTSMPPSETQAASQDLRTEIFDVSGLIWSQAANPYGAARNILFIEMKTSTEPVPADAKGHTEDLRGAITDPARIYGGSPLSQVAD